MKDGDSDLDLDRKFKDVLGVFGTHAQPERRARAERAASMKIEDKRRGDGRKRIYQYNGKVTAETFALGRACEEAMTCADRQTNPKAPPSGPGRVIEEGIALVAAKHKVVVSG